jgi:hypothetical protein
MSALFEKGSLSTGFAVEYLERDNDARPRGGGLLFFTLNASHISGLWSRFKVVATGKRSVERCN